MGHTIKIKDHEGHEFNSIKELCEFWNIKRSTFENRYHKGWPMHECILTKKPKIIDHLGNEFDTIQAMCDYHGIKINAYYKRIAKNMPLKDILTTPKHKYIDHEGNTFNSIHDMAVYWNINESTLSLRLRKGMSIEDALSIVAKEVTDHTGKKHKSFQAMCDYYDIQRKTVDRRLKNGESLESALTRISTTRKTFTDHTGETFNNFTNMCKKWNMPSSTVQNRIYKLGLSIEEALTMPTNTQNTVGKTCKDHLGNEYQSIASMCCAYGIPRNVYHRRIKDGWDLEKALTTKINRRNGLGRIIYDHKGNSYTSVGEMCNAYGIDYAMYGSRIRQGMSLKDALETSPEQITIGKKTCVDHKGNTFKSQAEMMRFWGVTKDQMRSRIELGWTLQQILESPEHQSHKKPCVDHLGNEWDSQEEMLAHYGIHPTKFRHRLRVQGLSLAEALSPNSHHMNQITDPKGVTFECEADMCKYWNVPTSSYYHWMNKYKDIKIAITRPKTNWSYKDLTIIKSLKNNYFEVMFKNNTYVWDIHQVCDYYVQNYEPTTSSND